MSARLAVRVQPGAKRAGVRGRRADGTLELAVTAPPEDGRANRAVVELLCELLDRKPRQVRLVRGAAARIKWFEIEGLSEAELERRARSAAGEPDDG